MHSALTPFRRSQRLRSVIKSRGLSATTLARQVGLPAPNLQAYLTGDPGADLPSQALDKLERILGLPSTTGSPQRISGAPAATPASPKATAAATKHRIELAIRKWQLAEVDRRLTAAGRNQSARPAAFRDLLERGASTLMRDPSLGVPDHLDRPPGSPARANLGALSYFGLEVPDSVLGAAVSMISNGTAASKAHAYRCLLELGLKDADHADGTPDQHPLPGGQGPADAHPQGARDSPPRSNP